MLKILIVLSYLLVTTQFANADFTDTLNSFSEDFENASPLDLKIPYDSSKLTYKIKKLENSFNGQKKFMLLDIKYSGLKMEDMNNSTAQLICQGEFRGKSLKSERKTAPAKSNIEIITVYPYDNAGEKNPMVHQDFPGFNDIIDTVVCVY